MNQIIGNEELEFRMSYNSIDLLVVPLIYAEAIPHGASHRIPKTKSDKTHRHNISVETNIVLCRSYKTSHPILKLPLNQAQR